MIKKRNDFAQFPSCGGVVRSTGVVGFVGANLCVRLIRYVTGQTHRSARYGRWLVVQGMAVLVHPDEKTMVL